MLRVLGFFVILGITGVLYGLYSRVSSGPVACLSAVFATMLLQSFAASVTYDFIQFVMLYGLSAALLLLKACESGDFANGARPGRRSMAWLAGSGVLAGLCFLTKQSNGLSIAAALGVAVVCVSMGLGLRRAIGNAVVYSLGFAAPVAVILGWLLAERALVPFFDQVFLGASQSKGGLRAILLGWLGMTVDRERLKLGLQLLAFIAAIVLAGWSQRWVAGRLWPGAARAREGGGEAWSLDLLALLAASTMALVIPYVLPTLAEPIRLSKILERIRFQSLPWLVVISTLVGFLASAALCLTRAGRGVRARAWQVLIWTSLGMVIGAGTSAPGIGEGGIYFGAGVALACLLESFPSPRSVARLAFAGFALLMVVNLSSNKYILPYLWWGYQVADIRESTQRVHVRESADRQNPRLRGFRLPAKELEVLAEVKSILERHSRPGEPIFTFPQIPLFYLLTDRWPDTFALVHWFDVTPDSVVAEDMKRLERNPPKVIVVFDPPDFSWQAHEKHFRAGKPLMQREMDLLLRRMTSEPGAYTLEASYDISYEHTLKVWVRSDQGTSQDSSTGLGEIGSRQAPGRRASDPVLDPTPP